MPPKKKETHASVDARRMKARSAGQRSARDSSVTPSPTRRLIEGNQDILHYSPERLRRTLVVDLDATFVHTLPRTQALVDSLERAIASVKCPDARREIRSRVVYFSLGRSRLVTVIRPHSLDFLELAVYYFRNVIVWSAGGAEYVREIVDILFPPHVPRAGHVMTWSDVRIEESATDAGRAASPSHDDYQDFSKPLEKVYAADPEANETNTLMLDDRDDIARHNPENLIQIPEYRPPLTAAGLAVAHDSALERFARWLMRGEVVNAKDVRDLDKGGIFA